MTDSMRDNLLYRPLLAPDLGYRSDDEFQRIRKTTQADFPSKIPVFKDTTPEDAPIRLYNDWTDIQNLLPMLPKGLQDTGDSIEELKKQLISVFPDGKNPNRDTNTPQVTSITDDSDGNIIPSDTSSTTAAVADTNYEAPKIRDISSLFPATIPIKLEVIPPRTIIQLLQDSY